MDDVQRNSLTVNDPKAKKRLQLVPNMVPLLGNGSVEAESSIKVGATSDITNQIVSPLTTQEKKRSRKNGDLNNSETQKPISADSKMESDRAQ